MELLELMEDWKGYDSVKANRSENWEERLVETINLLSNKSGMSEHKREYLIREALTTSDFPYLFGDVLDRQLLAAYKEAPTVMKQICHPGKRNDFKKGYAFKMSDGDQRLEKVGEKGEYPASGRSETKYEYALAKYGRQFDISWEAIINDDLDALGDTAARFARAARRTEEYFLTSLLWDAAGPLDAYFSVANGGAAVSTNALTIANLETAIQAMAGFTDLNSEPILNRPKFLMVGPGLEFTARQILTSSLKMWVEGTGAAPTVYPTTNVVADYGIKLLINYYIPIIDTTNGGTTWALFSDPIDLAAAEFGLLKGHENPEIFMKSSNQTRVGGGVASPLDGDFETDNILYKVRHCLGGVTMDGRAGWASDGA